jgi:sigma-E factor negative regulatory protein RseC
MSQNNHVCSQAIIKEVGDNYVVAEIVIESTCAACHAKAACGVSERKQEKIKVAVENPTIYKVGEFVSVEMKQSLGFKAVLIAYLIPFIVLVLGLFVTYGISKNEILSIFIAFGSIAIYYVVISKLKDKFEKEFVFSIKKID